MKNQANAIDKKFVRNFPEIFNKPSLVNSYLEDYSSLIENSLKSKFCELKLNDKFAIYANGGFGRKEMFPNSDIDISIIELTKIKNFHELENFISFLWDQGFKVGHSVRSIKDVKKISKKDIKEFTSYLTRRPIFSNKLIDKEISEILFNLWPKKKFYKAKLYEQRNRHNEYYSTAYNLEPDLKESPGTLRDFQASLWILQHCFDLDTLKKVSNSKDFKEDFKDSINAYNFIKSLRFSTNIETKRNRLNFEAQIGISKLAKLKANSSKDSVEMMMKRYYEMASTLSYFNNIVFEKYAERFDKTSKKTKGIYKHKNKIGIYGYDLKSNKNLILQIFIEIGKSKRVDLIDTKTKSLLKKSAFLIDKNFREDDFFTNQFLEILRSKYNLSSILKTMKELGILQRFIPEFNDVVGQMQFDLFHVYTVDEHTLKVVKNMRQMKLYNQDGFELEHELINRVPKVEILYIAGIFHDLGKGKGGDHSEIGAKTSFNFAKRLGLSSTDAYLISWLVKNHLIMSSISQKRDIAEPSTILEFTKIVEQIEKLDYLYLLTINDIRATNPALWNGWKHQLLKELYALSRSKLNKEPAKASIEIAIDRKKNVIKNFNGSNQEIIKDYIANLNDNYFNKNSTATLNWQSNLVINSLKSELIIGCRTKFDGLIEIFIKVHNSEGLFYKLTKVLELSGLEVINANIFTSKDNRFAANTFITKNIHHQRTFNKADLTELENRIEKNFAKFENSKYKRLKPKKLNFEKIVNISHSKNDEKGRNLITIETSDSHGLLSNIAKVFYKEKASIFSARINTLGERVEDTFEIENVDQTLISNYKIKKIIKALKEVV